MQESAAVKAAQSEQEIEVVMCDARPVWVTLTQNTLKTFQLGIVQSQKG